MMPTSISRQDAKMKLGWAIWDCNCPTRPVFARDKPLSLVVAGSTRGLQHHHCRAHMSGTHSCIERAACEMFARPALLFRETSCQLEATCPLPQHTQFQRHSSGTPACKKSRWWFLQILRYA